MRVLLLLGAHLVAPLSCYLSLVITPDHVWDKDAMRGVETACFVTVVCTALAVLLLLRPVVRGSLAWWWLAPAGAMLLVGAARWIYAATVWP
ncbi:hypothetical protein [Streptomyces sp. NRRL F-5053]|uniref:hypothetical protein n=1 Tax=Streptomyces sp. NRRL F-5053 TaxID=1463854 RepID=UPI00133125F8|nr:hypothetical protein [Streptomyces sp. NRRL F-5053]